MIKIKRLIGLIILLVALVGCSDDSAEYKQNLKSAVDDVMKNTGEIEDVVEDYAFIWSLSIENSSPIPVWEMAVHTGLDEDEVESIFEINNAGNVTNDFSSNIHSLKSRFEENGTIEEIKNSIKDVKDQVSELNDPPKGYDKVYDELLELYDLSETYAEMALDPSGSLQDFTSKKNQVLDDIKGKQKRIDVLMPND